VTLQIVVRESGGEPVIELHGWLRGAVIGEFQDACAHRTPPLRIDLENLSGASADGILALKEQRARGAVLTGASPYIELLLSPGKSAPGSQKDS
jgi:hypothetical protein